MQRKILENFARKKETLKTISIVTIFAIAMAFLESVFVYYIRMIRYPKGFNFYSINSLSSEILNIEMFRELSTLIILFIVAILVAKGFYKRFAYFLYAFAIWDIFYYVFLKLIINWPESLLTWDLLFLIPVPWVAPVIAPVLVSLAFIGGGFLVLRMSARGIMWRCNRWCVIGFLLATIIIFWSFCLDWRHIAGGGLPRSFPWGIFCAGELLLIGVFIFVYRVSLSRALHEPNH